MTPGTMPLISIVTPSFNQARFLRRTIDSVLAQDYPNVEYIVIDGGSTDGSIDVLRSYGDRVRWIAEPDHGQSDAINKGFARCHGAIRAYLNSDDVLWPGALRTVAKHFSQHPDWDLIYGNAYHIDADDRILGRYPTTPYSLERLLQNCIICQPAAFWRAGIAERVGSFDAALHYAMDLDYWLRIDGAGGRIVQVPEVLGCSRVHPATKTLSARAGVYREILATCRQHAGQAGFSQYFAYWHYRCHEAPSGWPRWLPWCQFCCALLHSRWDRHRGRVLPLAADLIAALGRRIACGAIARTRPVPHNWLPADSVLDLPTGNRLRLVGSAPRDTELVVSVNGTPIARRSLQAHEVQFIDVALPADCPAVRLSFSAHAIDAAGRERAFRLHEISGLACKGVRAPLRGAAESDDVITPPSPAAALPRDT